MKRSKEQIQVELEAVTGVLLGHYKAALKHTAIKDLSDTQLLGVLCSINQSLLVIVEVLIDIREGLANQ